MGLIFGECYIIQPHFHLYFFNSFYMKRFLPVIIIAILLVGVGIALTKYDIINLSSSVLGSSTTPKAGDTVVVDYVGTLDDGTEFDSSKKEGRSPLEFVIGSKSMIQ